MKLKDVINILIIIGVGYLIYRSFTKEDDKKPPVSYDYKTDFIKLEKTFSEKLSELQEELKKFKNAPPLKIIEYQKEIEKPNYIITEVNDSLIKIIDSLENHIVDVSTDFITRYPETPKLINMELNRDSLTLSFFDRFANSYDFNYPMDFDNYEYIFYDGGLNYFYNPIDTKDRWLNGELWLLGGYDWINKRYDFSTEYNLNMGKNFLIRLEAGAYIGNPINSNNNNLSSKLGYRIR